MDRMQKIIVISPAIVPIMTPKVDSPIPIPTLRITAQLYPSYESPEAVCSSLLLKETGKRIVLHISRFKQYANPERKLIKRIIDNFKKFDITFG